MPTLHWIGKEKVINHHADVPFRVLEHAYGFENGKQSKKQTDSGNKIIHGDNLEALKTLLPEYEGKVKCIYIDPPYNTGEEKWVYNDNVNDPKIKKWLGQVVGKESEDLSRHDKWLCMMYPRLKLLHKLLADDGAIFISIDDNEQANLKTICDEIFGANQFVGTYFWYKSETPPNLSHKIKRNIEYVICYSKTKNSNRFYGIKKESPSNDPLTKPQNTIKDLTFPANSIEIKFPNKTIPAGIYGTDKFPNELLDDLIIENGTNKNEVIFRNKFIWLQEKLEEELKNNTKIFLSKSLVLSYKKAEYSNEAPPNLINYEVGVDTTENAGKELEKIFGKKVFDFPKSPSLIEYLINFLCDKNAIILDSFAGSGTTAHAVLNLNRKDNGNRKFVLVELMDYAETITAERVRRVANGYSYNRTEKKQTITENVAGTGGSFDFYELGLPMFLDDENLNEAVGEEKIRQYIFYTETRTTLPDTKHNDNKYFLEKYNDTAYYFNYEKDRTTTLDHDFLSSIKTKAEQYIIYADNCLLTKAFMTKYNIIFKKIPRDITRF